MAKILIIEDDAFLGEILIQKLNSAGYTVEIERDGDSGLKKIQEWKPELVLLDFVLPRKNGLEILMDKKQDPSIAKIPVIMLTNSLHPIEGTEIAAFGISEFLIKAEFTPDEILRKVKAVLEKNATPENADADKRHGVLSGKNILLVEDDTFLSSILSKRLMTVGANVINVGTGEDALAYLKDTMPDIALLDVLLPGISGFQVLESIRKEERTKNLKVIVVSNFNQAEDIEKAKKMGSQFMVKAMTTPDDIVHQIEKIFA
ncbi:MAG: two-component response regulator [Candidatus Taylorbacteria bacterium]|nr:two-component response regulator [Candidatus Taylorbacteria bacterium]